MNQDFLTSEEINHLEELLNKKYQHYLEGRNFQIDCTADELGAFATVTLANADKSFCYPVEGRMAFKAQEKTEKEAAIFLIDYIDLYFEEYLMEEDEPTYLPIDWKEFEWDAITFELRGQLVNKNLEDRADELLKQDTLPPPTQH